MVVDDLCWPEVVTTDRVKRTLAETIVARVAEACGGDSDFVLTPDRAEAPERQALRTIVTGHGRIVPWAINGVAVATGDRDVAAVALMRMLDSAADQVTIVARAPNGGLSDAELARFLNDVLVADVDTADWSAFAGIVFDDGLPIKVIDRDGHHPVHG